MAERPWRPDWRTRLSEWLVAHGAEPEVAVAIAGALEASGLSVTEARAWLSERGGEFPANGMWTPDWAWRQVPVDAIEDGHASLVLEAARRFAAATSDERLIARALGRDVAAARALTGSDERRTQTVAAIVRLLRERLGSPARVNEALDAERWADRDDPSERNMVAEIVAGGEQELLRRLRDGNIDLEQRLAHGVMRQIAIPGVEEWNPYWPPRER